MIISTVSTKKKDDPDSPMEELEGGFSQLPKEWEEMPWELRNAYIHDLCVNWGMPVDCEVKKFWLAG